MKLSEISHTWIVLRVIDDVVFAVSHDKTHMLAGNVVLRVADGQRYVVDDDLGDCVQTVRLSHSRATTRRHWSDR